ncbi:hypothetical protein [Dysgonomonas sp. 25]|uniref:hypothetical protein n=1 Tax=Dysgonomonas sp. 25 TaxID=2302933 RepID=UPI0013D68D31|nr:hypothetical protein [Dysgonomonas sp. 25]NDV67570.1 hypothetical protein [Dysgonomonas sp. 25]
MISVIIGGAFFILLGILAVPSLLLSKRPDAKEMLDKIVPYQGWIGVVAFLYGIWNLIDLITHIDYLTAGPLFLIFWVLYLAIVVVELGLGFLLGYGLISKYALSKNEAAKAKGEEMLAKVAPLKGKLGILAIIVGIAYIVLWFIAF